MLNIEEIKKAVNNFNYYLTTIIVANPQDILKLNMDDYYSNYWFISNINCPLGEALILKEDGETKRMLYNFFTEHQDRMWKGTKIDEKIKS